MSEKSCYNHPKIPKIKNGVFLKIAETISHDHSGYRETRHSILNIIKLDEQLIVNMHLK